MGDGPSRVTRSRPSWSPFILAAITSSAPNARHTDTGTGLTKAPSTSHCRSRRTGVNRPGSEIAVRRTSARRPSCSQTSWPVRRSVVTATNGTGSSSTSRSPK